MTQVKIEHLMTNLVHVDLGDKSIYFSYSTPIAFFTPKTKLVCCENIWSKTTGKHLNYLSKIKENRLPYEKFQQLLKEVLK